MSKGRSLAVCATLYSWIFFRLLFQAFGAFVSYHLNIEILWSDQYYDFDYDVFCLEQFYSTEMFT
jgi:hypothetical protein